MLIILCLEKEFYKVISRCVCRKLPSYFLTQIQEKLEGVIVNGHPTEHLPHNLHLSFTGVEASTVLSHLNLKETYASAGSACNAHEINISHVLKAMKVLDKLSRGSIRFSLGKYTNKKDIDNVVKILAEVISSLRKVI